MDSTEFSSSKYNRKEHWTTKADDEIAEMPPTEFLLSQRSQPKDTAIRMQHPGGNHMINNIRLVARGYGFERHSKPIVQITDRDAFFLQRQSHYLLRVDVSRLNRRFHIFDVPLSPKAGDTQSQKQFGITCRQEEKIGNRACSSTAPPHPLEKTSDRWWCAYLYYAVEVANIDSQLQRRRSDNCAVRLCSEGSLGSAPLVGRQRTVGDKRPNSSATQTRCKFLNPSAAVGKYEPSFTPMDA